MSNSVVQESNTVNRQYKSSIFAMLFGEREALLELYNAVNGTDYRDPELLEINTLKNAIYLAVRNDVSFLMDFRLHLYEHQSTWNPNIPLRDLFYVSNLYSKITESENLHGSRRIKIPAPRFLVFYNGREDYPDRVVMKLSEMYGKKEKNPSLELEVVILNINEGHNKALMDACRTLREYAIYTAKVRRNVRERNQPLTNAVESAVSECIREGVLESFLRKQRAEAISVSIFEYDFARHMAAISEESREEGREEGRKEGLEEGYRQGMIQKKLADGKSSEQIAKELEQGEQSVRVLIERMITEQQRDKNGGIADGDGKEENG